jgi:hypothetical protein
VSYKREKVWKICVHYNSIVVVVTKVERKEEKKNIMEWSIRRWGLKRGISQEGKSEDKNQVNNNRNTVTWPRRYLRKKKRRKTRRF